MLWRYCLACRAFAPFTGCRRRANDLKQARTNKGNRRQAISGALNKFGGGNAADLSQRKAEAGDRRSRTEKMKPYLMVLFIGWIVMLPDAVRPARQSVLNIIRNTGLFQRFL
jgi:hypothetical protein